MSSEALVEFIEQWEASELKVENDPTFLNLFVQYLLEDDIVVIPDGEGAYFGKQCIIKCDDRFSWSLTNDPVFEVAYDNKKVVIYTGRHNGFWVPSYASLDRDHRDSEVIRMILKDKLERYVGINLLHDVGWRIES